FIAQPVALGRADLRRPHVRRLALAYRGEDGDGAQLRVDDALVAEEGDERQDLLRQLGAVEQHAERAAHVAEDFLDSLDDGVVLGGDGRFAGDGRETRHWGSFRGTSCVAQSVSRCSDVVLHELLPSARALCGTLPACASASASWRTSTRSGSSATPRASATTPCGSPTARCCSPTATRCLRWPRSTRRGFGWVRARRSAARAFRPSTRPRWPRSTASRRGVFTWASAPATPRCARWVSGR